jgi:hypothetical protein
MLESFLGSAESFLEDRADDTRGPVQCKLVS